MSLGLDLRGGIYLRVRGRCRWCGEAGVVAPGARLSGSRCGNRSCSTQWVEGGAGGVDVVFKDAATAASKATKGSRGTRLRIVALTGSTDGLTISATLSPTQVKQRQDLRFKQNITALDG
jgi:hypothetical protein